MKLYYGLTESMLEASMIARKGREVGLSYGYYEAKFPTKSTAKKDNRILRVCKVCKNKFEPPRKKDGSISMRRVRCKKCIEEGKTR